MSFDGHATETELLLAAEGELPADRLSRVLDHVSRCPDCAAALHRLKEFDELLVWAGEELAFRKGLERMRRKAVWSTALPAARWGAPAVAALLIAVLLLAPPNGQLSARECLDRAAASEDSRRRAPRRIRIRTGMREWRLNGVLQTAGADPDLDRWRIALEHAGVAWNALLSAHGYRRWSESVPGKQQQVQRRAGKLCVVTRTPGPLRRAELVLDADTFLPSASVWEVEGLGELQATGEAEPAEPAVETGRRTPAAEEAPSPAAPKAAPDLEVTELEIRLALHELRADLGEPITIRPAGTAVKVEGIVDTKERADALRQRLAGIPHAEFQVRWPEERATAPVEPPAAAREFHRGRPALAEEWMKARFAGSSQAQQFAFRTLELVGEIQAHDYALRTLAERYPVSPPSPAAGMLETLRNAHRRQLKEAWCSLALHLRPLLYPDSRATAAPRMCEGPDELSSGEREALPLVVALVSWGGPNMGLEEALGRLHAVFRD